MALPTAVFPDAIFGGNEQDVTNDGAADTQFAQALDYNKLSTEIIALQQWTQAKKSIEVINKTGSSIPANKWVAASGRDATSGLLTIGKASKGLTDFWAIGILPAAIDDNAKGEVLLLGIHGPLATTGFGGVGSYWFLDGDGDPRQNPSDAEGDGPQRLARILVEDAANGFIFVDPSAGFEQVQSVFTRIGSLAASDDRWILTAGNIVRILRLAILSDTATSGSDGTNNWSFQVRNHTDSVDLIATPQTTQGAELAVNSRRIITLDQNQRVVDARSLELQIVKNGTPTDLSSAEIAAIVYYTSIPV